MPLHKITWAAAAFMAAFPVFSQQGVSAQSVGQQLINEELNHRQFLQRLERERERLKVETEIAKQRLDKRKTSVEFDALEDFEKNKGPSEPAGGGVGHQVVITDRPPAPLVEPPVKAATDEEKKPAKPEKAVPPAPPEVVGIVGETIIVKQVGKADTTILKVGEVYHGYRLKGIADQSVDFLWVIDGSTTTVYL